MDKPKKYYCKWWKQTAQYEATHVNVKTYKTTQHAVYDYISQMP